MPSVKSLVIVSRIRQLGSYEIGRRFRPMTAGIRALCPLSQRFGSRWAAVRERIGAGVQRNEAVLRLLAKMHHLLVH